MKPLVAIAAAIIASSLSHAAANESQTKANALLSSTFVASGANWFAALKSGNQWTLVELRNARPSFSPRPIPETDRLNGVTDRFTVYVTCDQHRTRNGEWSEWIKGTPGAGQLVVAMTGGLTAYWSANGERKKGAWSFRTGLGSKELSNDPALLRALINEPNRDHVVAHERELTLAEMKQAAEAGDPEAQYRFAKTYGEGGSDWNRWISAAAAQGYGPAEDDLAWTTNWARLSTASNPLFMESIMRSHGAELRRALVLASSAADKGFAHSRQLLGMAYEHGILVPRDSIEAYKWYRLVKGAETQTSSQSPNDALVKTMSMAQVQEGESRAANYRPGGTAKQIRSALIIPHLKLSGLASNGKDHITIVNGKRLVAGQAAELNVAGILVRITCVSVDAKTVVIHFVPDNTRVVLKTGAAPEVVR